VTEPNRRGVRVEADALTRRFGDTLALDGVTLTIGPGEAFGLLGANGAGKTTFIRCLTGVLLPSGGDVRVDGISPLSDPAAVRARLGFVAETSRLYPELSVLAFLRFAAGARGLALAGWVANHVDPHMAAAEENVRALEARLAAPLGIGFCSFSR